MEEVSDALRQGTLRLTRIPKESVKLELNGLYLHWLDHWRTCKVMGRMSMELLPYGMWWMQQQRGQSQVRPNPPHRAAMFSQDRKYAVYFGRPPLYCVLDLTEADCRSRCVCLIPHFRRTGANELLVFEKG